jgi:hypothetical protein
MQQQTGRRGASVANTTDRGWGRGPRHNRGIVRISVIGSTDPSLSGRGVRVTPLNIGAGERIRTTDLASPTWLGAAAARIQLRACVK